MRFTKTLLGILGAVLLMSAATFAQSNVRYDTNYVAFNTKVCWEAATNTGIDFCLRRSASGALSFEKADGTLATLNFAGGSATDGYFIVPAASCGFRTSGTAGATNNTIVNDGASFTPVIQGSSTAAGASNNTLTCNVIIPTRLTAGKGITITDITVAYGVQTTALTSLGAPTISTITLPTPGTAETASTVTPVAIAPALTVTPVVGSANLGLTTAGSYFTEKVAIASPFLALNSDLTLVQFAQVFAQSAAAAQLISVPGLIVHYNVNPL